MKILQAKPVTSVAADLLFVINNIDPRVLDCTCTLAVPSTAPHLPVNIGFSSAEMTHLDIDLGRINIFPDSIVRVTIRIAPTAENQNVSFLQSDYCVTAGDDALLNFAFREAGAQWYSATQVVFYCQKSGHLDPSGYNLGFVFRDADEPANLMVAFYDPKIKNDG